MPYKSLEEVQKKIQNQNNPRSTNNNVSMESTFKNLQQNRGIQDVKFDLNTDAVYDRLSDGSYIAKFPTYSSGVGEEDRLAKSQSTTEKVLYGLGKNATKALAYAVDATVGTVYGLANGISKGSMSAVWDNEFSNSLDDFNKRLDNKLPNYYSDEEKSMNILQSMGTANFWFNDVAGGMAFVVGALLPELAIGAATGGASFAVGMGRAAGRTYARGLSKGIVGKALNKVDDTLRYSQGRQVIRQKYAEIFGKKVGDIASTAGFLVRTSNFEAGMEARHNFKEAMDTYYQSFEDMNGRPPSMEEAIKFTDEARVAANGVYGANMVILGVSNAAMFGKAFDLRLPRVGKKTENFFNRALGLGTKTLEDGTRVMRGANRTQKLVGNTYKILSKPAIEGLYEEGMQGVAGKTMQNYLEETYDPNRDYSTTMFSHFLDAMSEQYTSKEGWKEIGIGMIIGFAGGAIQPGAIKSGEAFAGLGKNSRASREKQIQSELETVNKGIEALQENIAYTITPGKGPRTLRAMNKASLASESRVAIEDENFTPDVDNTKLSLSFIQSQEHIKSSREIVEDFNRIIDNTQFSEEQVAELENIGISVEQHKESLKEDFNRVRKDYNFAKKSIEAIGLDRKLKDTPANLQDIGDAMIYNIVLGRNALAKGQQVGKEIENIIGKTGLASHIEFYNNLSTEEKQKVEELKREKAKLKSLQDQALEQQNKLANISPRRVGKDTDQSLKSDYEKTTALYVVTTQKVGETQARIDSLTEALDKQFQSSKFSLGEKTDSDLSYSVADIVEQMDYLDTYVDSLNSAGKNVEANAIQGLILDFKTYHDFHREMVNNHRNMMDTNYFSSKDGMSLVEALVGPRYKMSEDFKKIIEENNETIDKSLGLVGVRGKATVQEELTKAIQDNPEISEREKFRLESIIRLMLSANSMNTAIARLDAINTIPEATKTNGLFVEGDTVQLRQRLDINKEGLSSQEILDKTIDKILAEIDFLKNNATNQQKISRLEKELGELKAQRDSTTTEKSVEEQEGNRTDFKVGDKFIWGFVGEVVTVTAVDSDSVTFTDPRKENGTRKAGKVGVLNAINDPKENAYSEVNQNNARDSKESTTQQTTPTEKRLESEEVKESSWKNTLVDLLIEKYKQRVASEGRNENKQVIAVFESWRNIDLTPTVVDSMLSSIYANIRTAEYSNKNDNEIEKYTREVSELLKRVQDENGWHYRIPKTATTSGKGQSRISLNVTGSKALIDILDKIVSEYGIYYKTPSDPNGWSTRHDPVTIYINNENLTESQIEELKNRVVNETTKFIRSNEGFGVYGENISIGVEFGQEASEKTAQDLVSRGKKIDANIAEGIKNYLTRRGSNQVKGSVGQQLAVAELLNLIENNQTTVTEESLEETTAIQPISTTSTTQKVLDNLRQELETEEASEFKSQEVIDQLSGMIAILEGKQERESLPQSEPKTEEDSTIIQQAFESVFEEIPQPEGVTLFGDMTRGMEITLNRMEAGVPVSVTALKEVNDYLYQVYKNILSIKKTANTEAQSSMGLTLAYLEQTQRQLEQTLNFIADYDTAFKSGANLPTFNVSPEGTVYEASNQGERTNDGENQERDSQVEKAIDKQQDATQKSQQEEGSEQGSQIQPRGTQQGQQNQEQTTEQGANVSNRNIRSKEEIDDPISKKEQELLSAKKGIRTVDSEDYKRLKELTEKEQTNQLNEQEFNELEELRNDIDKWFLASGTIVEGVRLSDLITQRATIETAVVTPLENAEMVSEKEVIEQANFRDTKSNYNSDLSLTYDSVTVKEDRNTGKLIISGIKPENIQEVFANFDGTPIDFQYEIIQPKNDIAIDRSELSKINTGTSKISINPTNQDTTSSYSVVMVWEQDINGEITNGPLKNQFDDEIDPHQPQAVYEAQVGDKIILKIDSRNPYNQERLDAYINAKTEKEKKEALERLRIEANISIYNEKGEKLGTLKAKRSNDVATEKDEMFEMFRDKIFEDEDFVGQLAGVAVVHEIESKPLSIRQILPGAPNITMTKDEDGEVAFLHKGVTEQDAKKIVDIGYLENGKMVSRNKMEGVDGTFIAPSRKRSGRVPFVVIQHGNKLIAYPVKLAEREVADLTEFSKVFNSEVEDVDKAIRLNKMLAAFGVNVKDPGNFFFSAGTVNNLSEEFFNKMVDKVNQINYFYPLKEWIKSDIPMESILTQQALINIDLSNPFHSPKVAIEFKEAFAEFEGKNKKSKTKKKDTESKTTEAKKKANKPTTKDEAGKLFESLPETVQEVVDPIEKLPTTKEIDEAAKENENKNC